MRRLSVSFLAATLAWLQTFEAASVKPSGPQSGNRIEGGPGTRDPVRYRYTSATLEDLIVTAYGIEYFQVSSKAPIDRDSFDVEATMAPGTTREQFRVMLQNLLAERFRLQLHRETRDFPGFALVAAKSGFKLKPAPGPTAPPASADGSGFPDLPPGKPGIVANHTMRDGHFLVRMRAQQMPLSELARGLHIPGDMPAVDRTGIAGVYDFTLEYSYPALASEGLLEAPPAPSVFTALQQQLGLQLVAMRLPFSVVVVDSFDKVPSAN